jgi:pimeloyl-ACP methyl ester carboxylesterase
LLIIKRILLTMAMLLLIVYGGLVAYAYWPYGDGVPAIELADEDDLFIDVDGIRLRYKVWGEPQNNQPTIVLIHGFANSVETFRLLGPELARDHHVIALDLPGFGLSDKPSVYDYGNVNQAATISAFIAALQLQDVVIGGHSMGGAHVVHVAINDSAVVGALLMNPGIITTGVPSAAQYFIFPLPRLAAKTFADRGFRERFVKTSFVNPDLITAAVMDDLMLATKTDDYIEGATELMRHYVAGNEVTLLDDIRVPVLIVWGEQDSNKPAGEAEELQSLIANSRLVLVKNAGHYVHEEAPVATAKAIRDADSFWARKQ